MVCGPRQCPQLRAAHAAGLTSFRNAPRFSKHVSTVLGNKFGRRGAVGAKQA